MIVRLKVFWFGCPPDDRTAREFRNRDLEIEHRQTMLAASDLQFGRGAVFSLNEENLDNIADMLVSGARFIANHGLLLCAEWPNEALLERLPAELPEASVRHRINPEAHEFAELLARHDSGPACNGAIGFHYMANIEPLSAQDDLLVRRALAHCGVVKLNELGGGLSDARVFIANTSSANTIGSWTQPCFIKIDRLDKIRTEARKYENAAPFIPFGLRPNIERVVYGFDRAVLVGNFVSDSESLWDVIRRGQGGPALFGLFNKTLAHWRAYAHAKGPKRGSMAAELRSLAIIDPLRIRPEYEAKAIEWGALPVADIWNRLNALCQSFACGPIHGDLHAENVRVRGADAILIDFALANDDGPIAIDAALLEVWLAFVCHKEDRDRDQYRDDEWTAAVSELYAPARFGMPVPLAVEPGPYQWLRDAVTQIRTLALSSEVQKGEYKTAIVVALMRLAMYPPNCRAERYRRSKALHLASALSLSLDTEAPDDTV